MQETTASTPQPPSPTSREQMNIVIAGHVDHGKSTIIGRLLVDTHSLPEGKLEQVQETCRRNAKPFEYAFLLDALKDEQAQGITIDSARVFFKTPRRDYIIIDAPGHIEFLKNMVTGASRAEAALLVIDAEEGVRENSRRHGYMIGMLGISQIVVLVNKMDLVQWNRDVYEAIVAEYRHFLDDLGLRADFLPVSGREGDNVAAGGPRMPWYTGPTVLEALDALSKRPRPVDQPFRMPVQDVYKFTEHGDKRRIIVGTIETGRVRVGDQVVFYPSGKSSTVRTIEAFNAPPQTEAVAGQATALTLETQIYIARGEIATLAGQPPCRVSSRLEANLFWMGRGPMIKDKPYLIRIGTAKETVHLEEVLSTMDAADLNTTRRKDSIEHHDVAECVLQTRRAVAFDEVGQVAPTGRFVIVDDYEIRGGGIIRQALSDEQRWVRDYVMQRNVRWQSGAIGRDDRAERYSQRPTLVLVTGGRNVGKKRLARAVEARLFADGRVVYFLGIGNVLYGVDADIKTPGSDANRPEHLRRLAEVANVLLDAGMILVVTAIGLRQEDFDLIRAAVDVPSVYVVWLGPEPTDIAHDLILPAVEPVDDAVDQVKQLLQDKGVIFRL